MTTTPDVRRWQPADPDAVEAAYRGGVAVAALARREGVGDQTVRRWLQGRGVPLRRNAVRMPVPRAWEPADPEALWRDYLAAGSVRALGPKYGVHPETIRLWMRRRGWRRPAGLSRKVSDPEAVVRAYRDGAAEQDLAARHGVSAATIRNLLRKHGAEIRHGRFGPARDWEPADPAGLIREYRDGASAASLGRKHGAGAMTVLRFLRRQGVAIWNSGPRRRKSPA